MTKRKSDKLTVPNQQALADVLGVHRRTLHDYAKQGCPLIKAKSGGYVVAPAAAWYGRMLMRRQIRNFAWPAGVGITVRENLELLLDDHEKSFSLWLEQEHSE